MAEAGIAGRGVLLDYYAYVQRHKITFDPLDTYAISIDNLEACRREQGTEFKPGDILLIRVGEYAPCYLANSQRIHRCIGEKFSRGAERGRN